MRAARSGGTDGQRRLAPVNRRQRTERLRLPGAPCVLDGRVALPCRAVASIQVSLRSRPCDANFRDIKRNLIFEARCWVLKRFAGKQTADVWKESATYRRDAVDLTKPEHRG